MRRCPMATGPCCRHPTCHGRRTTRRRSRWTARTWTGARPVRCRCRNGRARRLRHDRAALRPRLPVVVLHHAADQPAQRRVWRFSLKTACAIRWRCSAMRAVWPDGKPLSVRISANDWVGDEGMSRRKTRWRSRGVQGGRRRHHRRVRRPDLDEAKPVYGRMFQTPFSDRIRNEAGIPPWPWATSTSRPCEFDPDGGPGRPCLHRAPASGRSVLDAACGEQRSATGTRAGQTPTWPAVTRPCAWRNGPRSRSRSSRYDQPVRQACTGDRRRQRRWQCDCAHAG
jgi:hypothetical protein